MSLAPIDPSRAEGVLASMIGEYVWFARTGQDSIPRMDFGQPDLRIREPHPADASRSRAVRDALGRRIVVPTGEWHLFVESGFWSVRVRTLACDRADADIAEATRAAHVGKCLSLLDGQKLTGIARSDVNREWLLSFDHEGAVSIKATMDGPHGTGESDWTLFFEAGRYLTCSGDRTFGSGDVDAPRRRELALVEA